MKKIDLTKGRVTSVIIALALPIMGSSLLQFTYNLVDMLWVGALGSDAVASIGSSSFYIGLGYSINALVIIGTGIGVSHAIGRKDEREIKEYINASIIVNFVIGLIYLLVLVFLGKYFISFLNINNKVVEESSYYYLAISAPSLFFTFFNTLYTRILNSYGNSKYALKISAIGIVMNIILDPICIYVFNLGVLGAALATLISNFTMFIIYYFSGKDLFRYDFSIGMNKKKIMHIVRLGLPMSTQRILFTIINILLARIIATFGADAIAAQKIGLQIESITYMVIGGLNGAISGFTGQNYGAKKMKRLKEGYYSSLKIGIIYSLVMTVVFLFYNEPIIKLFMKEENVVNIASSYLKVIAFSTVFSTVEMVSNGFFTGIGKPKIPAIISIIFTALRIPLSILLIIYFDVKGVWISIALSSILKGAVSYILYLVTIRREDINVTEG